MSCGLLLLNYPDVSSMSVAGIFRELVLCCCLESTGSSATKEVGWEWSLHVWACWRRPSVCYPSLHTKESLKYIKREFNTLSWILKLLLSHSILLKKKLWSWLCIICQCLRFELRLIDRLSLAHMGVDEWVLIPWAWIKALVQARVLIYKLLITISYLDENGERQRLHNEEIYSLYRLLNIVRVIKSERLSWTGVM